MINNPRSGAKNSTVVVNATVLFYGVDCLNERIKLNARYKLLGGRRTAAALLLITAVGTVFFAVSPCVLRLLAASLFNGKEGSLTGTVCICALLLFSLVFMSAFKETVCAFFTLRARGESGDIFGWFRGRLLIKSIGLRLAAFGIKTGLFCLWMLIPALLGMGLHFLILTSSPDRRLVWAGLAAVGASAAVGFVFYLVSVQSLVCAPYLMAANPGLSPAGAINLSRKKTAGSRHRVLAFRLSFLPWFLLCLAGFPAFYVIPYYRQSLACYIFTE